MTRSDSGINRLEDLNGKTFAFSDETSTSGHIFARALLQRNNVELGHVFFAGGHPNAVRAVEDGKVAGGASFYSPPSAANERDGTKVGDARFLILKNMADQETRDAFLETRAGDRPDRSHPQRCLLRAARFPRVHLARLRGLAATGSSRLRTARAPTTISSPVSRRRRAPTPISTISGTPSRKTGVSASKLLDAAEAKLAERRAKQGSGS